MSSQADRSAPVLVPRGRREGWAFAAGIVLGFLAAMGVVLLPAWQASLLLWALSGAAALRLLLVVPGLPGLYGLVTGAGFAMLFMLGVVNGAGPSAGCQIELVGTTFECGALEVAPWLLIGLGLVALGWAGRLVDRIVTGAGGDPTAPVARSVVLSAAAGAVVLAALGSGIALIAWPDGPSPAPWAAYGKLADRSAAPLDRLAPETRSFLISIDPGHCWTEERSPVKRIDVDERVDSVIVTAIVERSYGGALCLSLHNEWVVLERPLGGRTLLVGGDNPQVATVIRPPRAPATKREADRPKRERTTAVE